MSTANDDLIKQYQTKWAADMAKGDTAAANDDHINAEAIRANAGYSGGADGSQYIPLSNNTANSNNLTSATSQSDYLNSLYKAKQQSAIAGLQSAYQNNVTDLNASAAKIPETYNTARNSTAATSAQNQANFNERAAASGLNNGAGGQVALSMANTLTGNISALDKQQAQAVSDIELQRTKLAQSYNSQIAQAMAANDAEKAQQLYNEAVRVDNSLAATSQAQAQLNQSQQSLDLNKQSAQTSQNEYSDSKAEANAKALASVGNYSGYKALYGWSDQDVANAEALFQQDWAYSHMPKSTSSGSSGSGTKKAAANPYTDTSTAATPTTDANGVVLDETSPYGIINDIDTLRGQGMSSEDIKAYAKQAALAGQISGSQYQMYVQYSG